MAKRSRLAGVNRKGMDPAFAIYYTVMFILYSFTYIQLAVQIFIIGFVLLDYLLKRRLHIRRNVMRNVFFLLGWFGLFTLLAALSQGWAVSVKQDSNTLLTLFRILAIGLALFLYVDSYERAIAVIKSFIFASLIMSVVDLATPPLSEDGKAGAEGFGPLIGQHRTPVGAGMAALILICLQLNKYEHFRWGKPLAVFFLISLFCSGSRGPFSSWGSSPRYTCFCSPPRRKECSISPARRCW
jgi:hypothetical protein